MDVFAKHYPGRNAIDGDELFLRLNVLARVVESDGTWPHSTTNVVEELRSEDSYWNSCMSLVLISMGTELLVQETSGRPRTKRSPIQ